MSLWDPFIGFSDTLSANRFLGEGVVSFGIIDKDLIWANKIILSFSNVEYMGYYSWDRNHSQENYYLPLKLQKKDKNYYGWIDIDGSENPIIKGFAINMTANKYILAGQTE